MWYRKGEDTPAKKRRRLPLKVVIEGREAPSRAADRDELGAECRRTGAIRRVIQAVRHEPGSLTRQWSAAQQMLAHYRMPEGRDVAQVFIALAQKHHWHWFHRRRDGHVATRSSGQHVRR